MPSYNYQKGFNKIDRVLKNTAKQYNLEGALNKHRALKHWDEIASGFVDEAQSLTKAVDFKKGVLTVACLSKEAARQVKLLAERIIYALNQVLGRQLVYAIYVEV